MLCIGLSLRRGLLQLEYGTMTSVLSNKLAVIHTSAWNQDLAHGHGLAILPVTWEDTRRDEKSGWGPNICDMTLACDGEPSSVLLYGRCSLRPATAGLEPC